MTKLKTIINEMIENILSERYDPPPRYQVGGHHGPLMKAEPWIGKQSLEKLAHHPKINDKNGHHKTLIVGHLKDHSSGNVKHVALLTHGKTTADEVESGNPKYGKTRKGKNVEHSWYEDTSHGHKYPNSSLIVTGHVAIHPDGKVETHGDVDMKKSHNLMVYK